MSVSFYYLEKLSISLMVVWLFYQLVLRRLTFYNWNRWYLLGYSLLSFFIASINIAAVAQTAVIYRTPIIRYIPAIGRYEGAVVSGAVPVGSAGPRWEDVLAAIILAGMAILLVRFTIRCLALRRIRQRAMLISDGALKMEGALKMGGALKMDGALKIYQVDEKIIPFSFGGSIYINLQLHTENEKEEIILHEYVHIRQKHTMDILLAELLCIVNWYNPFAWMIRHAVRQNLEFIADHKVLESGLDRKGYQYHLLKVVGEPRYRLANSFNFSSLKKRIVMMNKMKSTGLHLVKFLFIVPLAGVLLIAFRDKVDGVFLNRDGVIFINDAGLVIDLADHQPLAGVRVTEQYSGLSTMSDAKGFFKLRIPVTNDSVRVHLVFVKQGYENDVRESFIPHVKKSRGMIDISVMKDPSKKNGSMFIAPFMRATPENPNYEDAVVALKDVEGLNADLKRIRQLEKDHPEVSKFFTSEDKEKQIVVFKNGQVDRYGYPGGATVADMEKIYGPLPSLWTKNMMPVSRGYLDEWARISAAAEKEFHTANPNVRRIIFPGDSRVIVLLTTGEAHSYDMDSNAPEERAAFEKLYGQLPAIVPEHSK